VLLMSMELCNISSHSYDTASTVVQPSAVDGIVW
jgi:hypothetical protein